MYWSTGTNKSLRKGDFVFLIKLGKKPKGIVAIGMVGRDTEIKQWNYKKRVGPGNWIRFLEKIRPVNRCNIELQLLKEKFPGVNWSSQNCIAIPDDVFVALLQLWGMKKIEQAVESIVKRD